jgi:hypothetical protein
MQVELSAPVAPGQCKMGQVVTVRSADHELPCREIEVERANAQPPDEGRLRGLPGCGSRVRSWSDREGVV